MHLSAQEEYGLRCLLQVAKREHQGPVQIGEIAQAEGLSPEYTAKLMRVLRQADLVVSTRGANGGYKLTHPPENTTVWQVLQLVGGPLFSTTFCDSHPGQMRDCVHTSDCSLRSLWHRIDDVLAKNLGAITLADLFRQEPEMATFLHPEKPVQIGRPKAS